ncbi:MAG: serine--tRNA ligase, partial [Candidatus Omnitrophica bacterium]|nr:serine--tRNA ligase [Candidatus Omnitrophota bacterium]
MLDGKFIRENTELVKQALKNRGYDFDLDAFLQLDEKRRDLIKKIENIRFQ